MTFTCINVFKITNILRGGTYNCWLLYKLLLYTPEFRSHPLLSTLCQWNITLTQCNIFVTSKFIFIYTSNTVLEKFCVMILREKTVLDAREQSVKIYIVILKKNHKNYSFISTTVSSVVFHVYMLPIIDLSTLLANTDLSISNWVKNKNHYVI